MMRTSERGRSMIEMLGVLAIVGILSLGGIAGYSKAMQKYKQSKLMSEISQFVINIRSLYVYQLDYNGINNEILINSGSVPAAMLNNITSSQTEITHAFNGNVDVFLSNSINGDNKAFEIYIEGLDKSTCLILSTMDWSQDISSGFLSMYVSNNPDVTGPMMIDIKQSNDSNPDSGIYTVGQHEDSVPIPTKKAYDICSTCVSNECVIGLKYAN